MKDIDKPIVSDAAKVKARTVLTFNDYVSFVDHETFCGSWRRIMAEMETPTFWSDCDEARDNVFADFALAYVMLNSVSEEEQRSAARMFQQVNEIYTARTLRKINADFESNIRQQGYEYVGTISGIRQYKLRETPMPRPVKKRRKKS